MRTCATRACQKGAGVATEQHADYLGAAALRQIADANKRELTARERSGMMEAFSAASSLLRDVVLRQESVGQPIVNADVADVVDGLRV
jgi:DNA polymerase-3 subunit delta'